jgi:hypothetical protein
MDVDTLETWIKKSSCEFRHVPHCLELCTSRRTWEATVAQADDPLCKREAQGLFFYIFKKANVSNETRSSNNGSASLVLPLFLESPLPQGQGKKRAVRSTQIESLTVSHN